MALEIERKFLVDPEKLGPLGQGCRIIQGFIPTSTHTAVRVRLADDAAYLTLKGETRGAMRTEFEYAIPVKDAQEILAELCDERQIEKTRYLLQTSGASWEIDIFEGANAGLVVAEIELGDEAEQVELPPWVLKEVTGDARYYNANLVAHPFREWRND